MVCVFLQNKACCIVSIWIGTLGKIERVKRTLEKQQVGDGITVWLTGKITKRSKIWKKEVNYLYLNSCTFIYIYFFVTLEKSYFDQQQAQTEGANEETEEEIEIPTVPADPNVQDAQCEVCQDRFEQFYNEEKEEWQLRMAVRVNNKTYHPLCYDDYQASLNIPIDISASEDVPSSKELEDQRIPGLEIVLDDDDDDDDDAKDENAKSEPSGIGIEEASQEAKTEAVEDGKDNVAVEEEDDDDDVILNEVAPERIILDDDDDENEETTEYQPTVKVKIEPIDDGFMDVDGVVKVKNDGEIKIKTEPKDPGNIILTTDNSRYFFKS